MHISILGLRNFRNLRDGEYRFSPGLTLITGENGAGKTNLLEILSLLTGWGTFPGRKVGDLPRWGTSEKAFLKARFEGEYFLEVGSEVGRQNLLRCGSRRCTAGDIRSRVSGIFFIPSDMELVEGSSSVRRRFLNRLCALLHPHYATKLYEYKRLHRQKTSLLRQGRSTSGVDRLLAPSGGWLWDLRERALKLFVNRGLSSVGSILPLPVQVTLLRGGGGLHEDPGEDFARSLKSHAREERRRGRVLCGPAGDDLLLEVQGRLASVVLSRGQRRRLALALMIGMGYLLEGSSHRKPLFVMDEVTAELDMPGRALLFETLQTTTWQVLAATAEPFWEDWPGKIRSLRGGVLEE
jgi:DNA replication and repair protein RecF